MTTPGPTEGSSGSTPEPSLPQLSNVPSIPSGTNTQWLVKYYYYNFPNGPPPSPEDLAMLNRTLCAMINTTIGEINARNQAAQQYNEQVAKGEA